MIAQYIVPVAFVLGILAGFAPMYWWHSYTENKRELQIAKIERDQEKENVRIITKYSGLLNDVSDWYRRNPVRVRIQGGTSCPGGSDVRAEDVVLTVGGYKRSDGGSVGK